MVRRKNRHGRRRIRYAVVGLGYISQIAVLPAFEHARENSELTALVSGDAEKLKKLGRKYGIEDTYAYEQYGDCLNSGEIDGVHRIADQYAPSVHGVSGGGGHSRALREADGDG